MEKSICITPVAKINVCPCGDTLYYLNGRYKCYWCNRIILRVIPLNVKPSLPKRGIKLAKPTQPSSFVNLAPAFIGAHSGHKPDVVYR